MDDEKVTGLDAADFVLNYFTLILIELGSDR